ncbi:hypothetical protein TWF730_009200 [Orbilia blumenaviensis]|uniref:Uncharacterized protein n=1 Tax=Orbilia blumenaviensis TaxID=1796055 RepID=A0AAV9UZ32_9PEZI
MHRTVLLTIGTVAALLNLAYALPQTRRPSSTVTAGVSSPTPTPGNSSPPTKEVIHDVINNVLCTDPLTGTSTTYESHNIDIDDVGSVSKHKLAKRGNCFANTREGYLDYYDDPPSLDQMIRPARDRSTAGTHYNAYRPHDDPPVMSGVNSVQNAGYVQSPDENLIAEPSVEQSIEINMVEEGGLQDGRDGFDIQMDEFDGDGLEPGALDFERGIVGVRGGVGGGRNGEFGVHANTQRRRPLLDINAIIQNSMLYPNRNPGS